MEVEGFYYFDRQDSIWTSNFSNGTISSVKRYSFGKLKDLVSMYNIRGEKIKFGNFKNGAGELVQFFENGIKSSQGNYLDGFPNGEWKYYFENGGLKAEGKFAFADKTGIWKYYNAKTGKIKAKGTYSYHEPIGEWQFFDENGKLTYNTNVDEETFSLPFD